MNGLVDARNEIEKNEWLPQAIKEVLYRSSVAVNNLYTPLDENELITAIGSASFPIVQIAYAHEVPPYFTRKNQYVSLTGADLDFGRENTDVTQPGLYGFLQHPNSTITLVLFIRGQVVDLSVPTRPRIDPKGLYIRGLFDQYRRLVRGILRHQSHSPTLRAVGVLPGFVQKSYEKGKLQEYGEEVEMLKDNTVNSARFVAEATRQTLLKYGFTESNLILLGSSGTLGRVLSRTFPDALQLDVTENGKFPTHGRYLVLDMTGGGSLRYYSHRLTHEILWLNESFPPPLGTNFYGPNKPGKILHIQGVDGQITPPFPYGYGDIPPCCMGLVGQDAKSVKILEID